MSLKQRLGLETEPLFLMDGTAFIYRGFYANRTLQRSDGYPTNALYVTTRILLRILREERPAYFAFIMDGRGKNFRHHLFPLYKANRDAAPEELTLQMEPIRRMVRSLGLTLEVSDGCEADDCIASLAARHAGARPVIIVGADKDLRQCLAPGVWLWDPAAKEEKLISETSFRADTGLVPSQWPDVQALIGDVGDNIPGVPGVGPKTAQKLFADFHSLEDIRDGLDRLPPKLREKLEPHAEAMFLYRRLTTLALDYCEHLGMEEMAVRPMDGAGAASLLQEFELVSLRRELEAMLREGSLTCAEGSETARSRQGVLFISGGVPAPPVVQNASALPSCRHLPTAVAPASMIPGLGRRTGHVVAVAGKEWIFDGPLETLTPRLAEAAQVVAPDVKALLGADEAWRIIAAETWFDLGLAAYLLDPEERDYGWPRLAAHYGGLTDAPSAGPGLLALDIGAMLAGRLANQHLDALYHDLELPLIPVLSAMERRGVAVDPAAFKTFLRDVQTELDRLTARVYEAAGGSFNIRSAQQLGEMLFKTLNLPTAGKTRGGQLSTAQDSLEKLAGRHPVVDAVLEFRKLEKLRSTYLEPLPKLADAQGRIHTTFNQSATATGRLSSSNPNLQNIPVRGPLGLRMRACFIAGPGHALVSADYSQVELRVLAHMSQDPALLDAFRQGRDIHASTAALIYNIPTEEVTADQRREAKTINFGLIYGMGAQKLAQELKISPADAKSFIARYFERLGRLKRFYDGVEEKAKEQGYVTTLAGRRRYLPDIRSRNGQTSALARRQAVNTVIQGSAADIIKLAMLAVHADTELATARARLVLQVHDELLLEAPEAGAHAVGQRVARLMADVAPGGRPLDVPLAVDWGTGRSWGEAH